MSSGVWFPTLGLLAWLCCLSLGPAQGGKVLVLPVDGSHWLSMKILVKELSQRGHDILVLVPECSLLMNSTESYKIEIYKVPYTKAELDAEFNNLREDVFLRPPGIADMFVNMQRFVSFTALMGEGCESLLTNQPLMSQLRAEGFDVLLTDPFLPCGSIVAHLFSIPAVYFLRGLPCELDAHANQAPSPLSYVPVYFSGNTDIMTFPQRVNNMIMSLVESLMSKAMFSHFDNLVSRHIKDISTYKELIGHAAFWLLRFDFTFEYPRPVMPNTAFIGGFTCTKKAPLPAVSAKRMFARLNVWIYLKHIYILCFVLGSFKLLQKKKYTE